MELIFDDEICQMVELKAQTNYTVIYDAYVSPYLSSITIFFDLNGSYLNRLDSRVRALKSINFTFISNFSGSS